MRRSAFCASLRIDCGDRTHGDGALTIDQASAEKFVLTSSRQFPEWLESNRCSIAFTTYQAGKIFLLGRGGEGRLSVFERTFARSMGLAVSDDGRSLFSATQDRIQRFDNVVAPGQTTNDGYDAVYAPHAAWVTGDLDAHDVGFGADGRPLFVNTLFSCLATASDSHSFRPVWTPPFISKLAAEDRCHLNGMAIEAGIARYVTAVSRSDVADGWRDRRADGGVIVDVGSSEVILEGLSMPHSPRLRDGQLWLLNSGTGELGFADMRNAKFEAVAFCPGYARGLAFVGNHAVVGLSLARDDRTFTGLPLDDALTQRNSDPRCGLAIFDIERGEMTAWVRIDGLVRELYDVAVLPGISRPSLVGFKSDQVHYLISIDD